MHGQIILTQIETWLTKLSREEVELTEEMVDLMTDDIKLSLLRPQKRGFTLRMSNLGRPFCQLWWEKSGAVKVPKREKQQASIFAAGHMAEAWLMMVMKASGVPITDSQTYTKLMIAGDEISGTSDVLIKYDDEVLWDIKSASDYSFSKFKAGYGSVADNDAFGYVDQGFLYSKAQGLPFGGWIVINKNNGEVCVCEAPMLQDDAMAATFKRVEEKKTKLDTDAPFERCFEDEPETFNRKETGNRVLCFNCSWCDYKDACWPGVEHRTAIFSKAQNKPWKDYTEVNAEPDEDE